MGLAPSTGSNKALSLLHILMQWSKERRNKEDSDGLLE
jgi:hypothetical protein